MIRRPSPQSTTAPSYFEGKWTGERDGGPIRMFYEVAPDGAVLRQVERFADGRVSKEDLADYPDGLSQFGHGSLHELSFWDSQWDDAGAEELWLIPSKRAEFELVWDGEEGVGALAAGYELVDDPARIDPVAAHAYLTRSYWASGIPLEIVARSIANSLAVAVFHQGEQVAMARLVTDYATMAYLADVYVLEEHRGLGLSHAMLDWFHANPELQGLRRWILFTQDAQGLYTQHGWTPYPYPERLMVRDRPDIYQ